MFAYSFFLILFIPLIFLLKKPLIHGWNLWNWGWSFFSMSSYLDYWEKLYAANFTGNAWEETRARERSAVTSLQRCEYLGWEGMSSLNAGKSNCNAMNKHFILHVFLEIFQQGKERPVFIFLKSHTVTIKHRLNLRLVHLQPAKPPE